VRVDFAKMSSHPLVLLVEGGHSRGVEGVVADA
jgi:hypothetical protein